MVKNTWQLVELHGFWWAYEGELPPPEAFRTHGHTAPHILGPFTTRAFAEAQLPRLLSRRESRISADPAGTATPARTMAMTDEQRRWVYIIVAAAIGGAGGFLLQWWFQW